MIRKSMAVYKCLRQLGGRHVGKVGLITSKGAVGREVNTQLVIHPFTQVIMVMMTLERKSRMEVVAQVVAPKVVQG